MIICKVNGGLTTIQELGAKNETESNRIKVHLESDRVPSKFGDFSRRYGR